MLRSVVRTSPMAVLGILAMLMLVPGCGARTTHTSGESKTAKKAVDPALGRCVRLWNEQKNADANVRDSVVQPGETVDISVGLEQQTGRCVVTGITESNLHSSAGIFFALQFVEGSDWGGTYGAVGSDGGVVPIVPSDFSWNASVDDVGVISLRSSR